MPATHNPEPVNMKYAAPARKRVAIKAKRCKRRNAKSASLCWYKLKNCKITTGKTPDTNIHNEDLISKMCAAEPTTKRVPAMIKIIFRVELVMLSYDKNFFVVFFH